jgi:hypothetical protein
MHALAKRRKGCELGNFVAAGIACSKPMFTDKASSSESEEIGEPPMTARLPSGLRPRAYAASELLLDILYLTRQYVPHDLECVIVHCCVVEATMRPLLLGPDAPLHLLDEALPPESARGSISRRMIADRTGLARETVRRKTLKLIEAGLLAEDETGAVRTVRDLARAGAQALVSGVDAAVQRYAARVMQFGG